MEYFIFGKNKVLVIEDNEMNREKLKYIHSIRWNELIAEYYEGVHLSEYYFCEYSNNKDKYINTFCLKIHRVKYFMIEKSANIAYIVCTTELEKELRKALPNVNYCVVNLEKYIDKERRYYEY